MATAEIGALRVTLAMDAGKFNSGADKAGKKLNELEETAAKAGKAVAGALVAAAAAMAFATKQAIDFADEIGKMSQRVGIGTETLSGLAFAGALADVNLQQLDSALDKFNKTLGESAQLNSTAAQAFAALGVSVRNTDGSLRDTEAILLDIADKFAGYADGANKSALAMQLFGKAGADMIPLLNSGREGIEAAAEQARRFGVVIDKDFAKQAEEFNDSITRLKLALQGWALDLARVVAGPGADVINWIAEFIVHNRKLYAELENSFKSERVKSFQNDLADTVKLIAELEPKLAAANARVAELGPGFSLARAQAVLAVKGIGAQLEDANEKAVGLRTALAGIQESRIPPFTTAVNVEGQTDAPNTEAIRAALEERLLTIHAAALAMKDALDDALNPDFEPLLNGFQSTADKMKLVEDAARANAIGFREATKLFIDLKKQERDAIASTATMFGQTLTTVFKKSKAAAAAEAIINTAVGITKVWRDVPWPLNLAQAALVAASGVAQLAAINSASETGGGSAPTAPTGGGSGSGGETGGDAAPGRSLFIQGVDPAALYSGGMLEALIAAINTEVGNGATLISTRNIRA